MISWFKKKEAVGKDTGLTLAELEAEYAENLENITRLETALLGANKCVVELNELKEANKLVDRKTSTTPWMEIVCDGIDPIKGVIINMDWNEAFTQYLKDSGLNTKDEEAAIQGWLLFMYQDQIEKLEQRVIDNKDRSQNNEYL
jgi:hypothetical protein